MLAQLSPPPCDRPVVTTRPLQSPTPLPLHLPRHRWNGISHRCLDKIGHEVLRDKTIFLFSLTRCFIAYQLYEIRRIKTAVSEKHGFLTYSWADRQYPGGPVRLDCPSLHPVSVPRKGLALSQDEQKKNRLGHYPCFWRRHSYKY